MKKQHQRRIARSLDPRDKNAGAHRSRQDEDRRGYQRRGKVRLFAMSYAYLCLTY